MQIAQYQSINHYGWASGSTEHTISPFPRTPASLPTKPNKKLQPASGRGMAQNAERPATLTPAPLLPPAEIQALLAWCNVP